MEYIITIMGCPWKIRVGEHKDLQDRNATGLCDPDKREILIENEEMSEDLFNRTLMHEIMHAMTFMGGVSEVLDEKVVESICVLAENFVNMFELRKGVIMACKAGSGKKKKKPKK
jgi:hypothetical protein